MSASRDEADSTEEEHWFRSSTESGEVVGAVDRSGTVPTFVVADVTRDDAWLSMAATDALPLTSWR